MKNHSIQVGDDHASIERYALLKYGYMTLKALVIMENSECGHKRCYFCQLYFRICFYSSP